MQMSLEEAIGYVAADELIEASFLFLILQIYTTTTITTTKPFSPKQVEVG
jgi:hypothetical protein